MSECVLHDDPDASPKECASSRCMYLDGGQCGYKAHQQRLLECGDMRSTITMLAKGADMRRIDVKQELQDVQARMRLNQMCEDYCGRSLLDARTTDVEEIRRLIREESNADYLLYQLEKSLNLIKEYQE